MKRRKGGKVGSCTSCTTFVSVVDVASRVDSQFSYVIPSNLFGLAGAAPPLTSSVKRASDLLRLPSFIHQQHQPPQKHLSRALYGSQARDKPIQRWTHTQQTPLSPRDRPYAPSSTQANSTLPSSHHGQESLSYRYSHQPQLQDGLIGAASATTYLPDFTLATPLFAQTSFDLEDLSAYTLPLDIADWTLPISSAPDYWEPFSVTSLENSIFENVNPPLRSTGAPEGNPLINTSPVDYNSILNSANANPPNDQVTPSPPSERMTPLPPKSNTPSPRSSTSTHKPSTEPPSRIEKRTKNTLAARRYRQKRVDQMAELEEALKETQVERDALKVRVARLEGEAEALRQLLRDRT